MNYCNIFAPELKFNTNLQKAKSKILMRKCKSTLFLLLMVGSICWAQEHSNRFFHSGLEIVVDVLPENDIYYSHQIGQGINIYNLAEVFQISAEKIMKLNKMDPKSPNATGKIVKIPIISSKILPNSSLKRQDQDYLSLIYKVKEGDNLFRIAKTYFNSDIHSIKSLNNKKTNDIQLGESLKIGWYAIGKINPSKSISKSQISQEKASTPKTKSIQDPPKVDAVKITKYYLSDVIGFFDRDAGNHKSNFVLHNEAKPGTTMDIYNPMFRRHIKAKVLGKIPDGTYSSDVQIILNSSAAKELGILDQRFKVNIKFEM